MRLFVLAVAALPALACRGERAGGADSTRVDTAEASATAEPSPCRLVSAGDVRAITGTDVRLVERGSVEDADGDCANFVAPDGAMYLAVSELESMTEFTSALSAPPPDRFPIRTALTGLGDEAMLYRDEESADRYLVTRVGERGAALVALDDSITEDQLRELARGVLRKL